MRRILTVLILLCLVAMPAAAIRAQGGQTVHVVQAGENLYRISLRYGVSISAIAQANNLTNINLIYVGQRLVIPGGTGAPAPGPTTAPSPGGNIYIVQRGDTLSTIARRFNTTVRAIASANGIVNINLILVGQRLVIPGATGLPGPAPTVNPNPIPGPGPVTGYEIGGNVAGLGANTQAVMRSAKMVWAKRQFPPGDQAALSFISEAKGAGFKVFLGIVGDKNQVLNAGYQDSYAQFVGQLAKQGADAIQVWNEMNIDREWPTGQINPASYVQLLAKAYNAIKANNANTLVITGAPSPTGAEGAFGLAKVWNDDRYYNGMAAAGAGRYADCIGVHYNEGIISPNQNTGDPRGDNYPTRYFRAMLNRALAPFPGKQACFSELGYLSPEGYGPLPGGFSWAANVTAQQQAQWLGEAVALARSTGRVRMLLVWNIDFTRYDAEDPQAGYAIIRPGNVCIACATIAAAMP